MSGREFLFQDCDGKLTADDLGAEAPRLDQRHAEWKTRAAT